MQPSSQKFVWFVKRQTGAFRHTLSICFQKKKKKKKKTKSRFSEVIHLFSKAGAFSYALSPLSGTNKNHSPLFQKKKIIIIK